MYGDIDRHAAFALAHPVFDPLTQIVLEHSWMLEQGTALVPATSATLTVNIGME